MQKTLNSGKQFFLMEKQKYEFFNKHKIYLVPLFKSLYIFFSKGKYSLPWPGFEPGLLRPQRRVLTTIRSRLRKVMCRAVLCFLYEGRFQLLSAEKILFLLIFFEIFNLCLCFLRKRRHPSSLKILYFQASKKKEKTACTTLMLLDWNASLKFVSCFEFSIEWFFL